MNIFKKSFADHFTLEKVKKERPPPNIINCALAVNGMQAISMVPQRNLIVFIIMRYCNSSFFNSSFFSTLKSAAENHLAVQGHLVNFGSELIP